MDSCHSLKCYIYLDKGIVALDKGSMSRVIGSVQSVSASHDPNIHDGTHSRLNTIISKNKGLPSFCIKIIFL